MSKKTTIEAEINLPEEKYSGKVIQLRKHPWNIKSKRVYNVNHEPSRTDQSQKDDCDVNLIIAKYRKTGQLAHLNQFQGQYADTTEFSDLQSALHTTMKAQDAFDSLPAHIRRHFDNSPVEMFNFLQDPKNDDEAIRLGLKKPRKPLVDNTQGDKSDPTTSGANANTKTKTPTPKTSDDK